MVSWWGERVDSVGRITPLGPRANASTTVWPEIRG